MLCACIVCVLVGGKNGATTAPVVAKGDRREREGEERLDRGSGKEKRGSCRDRERKRERVAFVVVVSRRG